MKSMQYSSTAATCLPHDVKLVGFRRRAGLVRGE